MKSSKRRISEKEIQKAISYIEKCIDAQHFSALWTFLRERNCCSKLWLEYSKLTEYFDSRRPSPEQKRSAEEYSFFYIVSLSITLKTLEKETYHHFNDSGLQKMGKAHVLKTVCRASDLVHGIPPSFQETSSCPKLDKLGARALHALLKKIHPEGSVSFNNKARKAILYVWALHYDWQVVRQLRNLLLFGNHKPAYYHSLFSHEWPFENDPDFASLTSIKAHARRELLRREYHTAVNKEHHFQTIDPTLKTNEGIAMIITSSGMEVDQKSVQNGLTSLRLNTNGDDMNDFVEKAKMVTMVQHFHHNLRQHLQTYYEPKEFDQVKRQKVTFNDESFSIYELVYLLSAFYSAAIMLQEHPMASLGAHRIKEMLKHGLNEFEVETLSVFQLADILNQTWDVKDDFWPMHYVKIPRNSLIGSIKHLVEFKECSDAKIEAMLDFLVDRPDFYGAYLVNGSYYFSTEMLVDPDHLARVHQQIIAHYLYKGEGKRKPEASKTQRSREKNVCHQLKNLFEGKGLICQANTDFKFTDFDGKEVEGEMDLLVHSPEEKVALVFEVKLNNTGAVGSEGKFRWFNGHLKKVKEQLAKDIKYLSGNCNENFEGYAFYYFMLTDNFFRDHNKFSFSNANTGMVVSMFELRCILGDYENNYVAPQDGVASLKKLAELLEQNWFWQKMYQQDQSKQSYRTALTVPPFSVQTAD